MRPLARRLLVGIAEFVRDVFGTVLILLLLALSFLVFTQSGATLAIRAAEGATGLFTVQSVEGRLFGSLRLEGLRYDDGTTQVEVDHLSLRWAPLALLLRQLRIERLEAGEVDIVLGARAEEEPETPSGPPPTRLPLDIWIDRASVAKLSLHNAEGEPIVLESIALSADWHGNRIVLRELAANTPWVGPLSLRGDARLDETQVEIARLQLQGFVQARLEGHYGYASPSDLRLQWQDLRWPPTGEAQFSSGRGELHWTGVLDDYRYVIDAVLRAEGHDTALHAHGQGSLSRITAEELVATLLGGELRAQADADWSGPLRVDADARLRNIDPALLRPDLPGRINGRVQARSVIDGSEPVVDFEAALQDSQLRGHALTLDVRGRYADGAVDLAHARFASGGSRVRAQGRVYPTLAVEAGLDSQDLTSLWPGLGGRAQLQLRADGEYTRPDVRASGTVEALRYGEIRLAQASLDADIDLDQHLRLRLDARELRAGRDIDTLRLRVDGSPERHRIDFGMDSREGSVTLAAEGRLDLDRPGWNGQLLESRLAPVSLAAWELEQPAALVLGPGVDLQSACWDSAGDARACLRVRIADPVQEFAVDLTRFELASLAPLLPPDLSVRGLLDGHAEARLDAGGLRHLRAEIRSGEGQLKRAGLPSLDWEPGLLRAEETPEGLVATLELPFAGGRIEGNARLAPGADLMQRSLEGSLRLAMPDIGFLRAFSAELQDVQGRLDGEFDFDGTLAELRPRGRVDVSDASLRLSTPGTQFRELRASVVADGSQPLEVRARTRVGDGELYVGGQIDPWNAPLSLDFRLSGYDAQLVRMPEANVWIAPNLVVTLAQRELRVTGTVEVPRADIQPPKGLGEGGVSPNSDQVIVTDGAEDEPAIAIFADVGLLLGKQVRFEGFGLKTRFTGNLQLREEPGTPTSGRGEIALVEGRYQAYGQDLTIETGRLLFTGGPVTEPAVELRATRKPRDDIEVGVLVRGTLDEPMLSLFSTPAMSQQQQLSWLILGRDLESSTGDDAALLANAALSMGLAGGEWLAQRFGGGLGLDEISLGARPGQSADQAQFTVGKYLSPGLFISYGIGLFQPGHTFRLEYDIGRGFKLATESGVESGGDLLYTIERDAKRRDPDAEAVKE